MDISLCFVWLRSWKLDRKIKEGVLRGRRKGAALRAGRYLTSGSFRLRLHSGLRQQGTLPSLRSGQALRSGFFSAGLEPCPDTRLVCSPLKLRLNGPPTVEVVLASRSQYPRSGWEYLDRGHAGDNCDSGGRGEYEVGVGSRGVGLLVGEGEGVADAVCLVDLHGLDDAFSVGREAE